MLDNFKVILWDFDGVLMNSNAIRDLGFQKVLANYPGEQVAELMKFHHANGGLSRYVKFRYFFEQVLKENVSDAQIQALAQSFSEIMRSLLVSPNLLIQDALNFVKLNFGKITMHVVSGSDQQELRWLCKEIGIDQYFASINGSPVAKKQLVLELLNNFQYNKAKVALIGDSVNDFEAASENGIQFFGYNNETLSNYSNDYIFSFAALNN